MKYRKSSQRQSSIQVKVESRGQLNHHRVTDAQKAQNQLLRDHKQLQFHFTPTSRSALMIRRIVTDSHISSSIRIKPLLKRITDASIELMLTELEIVIWSIYLDFFVLRSSGKSFNNLIYITAYAAKNYANDAEDLLTAKVYLSDKIRQFPLVYKRWLAEFQDELEIDAFRINQKFNKLTKPLLVQNDRKIVNYNYYVDNILESASAYNMTKKECKLKFIDAQSATSDEDNMQASALTLSMLNPDKQFVRKQDSLMFKPVNILERSIELGASWLPTEQEPGLTESRDSLFFSQYFNNSQQSMTLKLCVEQLQ